VAARAGAEELGEISEGGRNVGRHVEADSDSRDEL